LRNFEDDSSSISFLNYNDRDPNRSSGFEGNKTENLGNSMAFKKSRPSHLNKTPNSRQKLFTAKLSNSGISNLLPGQMTNDEVAHEVLVNNKIFNRQKQMIGDLGGGYKAIGIADRHSVRNSEWKQLFRKLNTVNKA
jgi:hypothetical protein